MVYVIPYEAEYECPKGHRFTTRCNPMKDGNEAMCPTCYAEWVAANVPNGRQISEPKRADDMKHIYD